MFNAQPIQMWCDLTLANKNNSFDNKYSHKSEVKWKEKKWYCKTRTQHLVCVCVCVYVEVGV